MTTTIDECEPRCDECGIHAEEAGLDWCGECGNCHDHCADYIDCQH